MLTIDTHCHVGLDWFEPVEVLVFQMDRNEVDKAVLVQHKGEFDNTYLIDCVRRFPGRFAAVGSVDTNRSDAVSELKRWVLEGIQGIRWHLDLARVPTDVLKRAEELNLRVSCAGAKEALASDAFRGIVEQLPGLIFIVEHLGFVTHTDKPPYTTYSRILNMAKYSNVYMKVHGLGELEPRPSPMTHPTFDVKRVSPFIEMALDAFGPSRLMIGTDSPPSSHREGYANVLRYLREYLSRYEPAVQAAIFGATADSLFTF